jgi:initiation factor 1A
MPKNTKGGKGFKKGKGGPSEPVFIDIQPDQYMARAVRILGNRNVLCFCHDNVTRLCHISRGMKGHSEEKKIETGDLILVSLRDFNADNPKLIKRGDIIGKYSPEQTRQIRNEGTYPKLFMKLEENGIVNMDSVGQELTGIIMTKDDDGFDFESGSGSEEEEEDDEHGNNEETKVVDKRDKSKPVRGVREVRDAETIEGADVNIDDL